MMLLSGRVRLLLSILALVGFAVVAALELTSWHGLEAVTLDDEPISDWETRFGLSASKSVLKQPLPEVAARLLEDTATVRVDIDYSLPATLHIKTNRFTPICFVLDEGTGRLHGLNHQARVVPLPPSQRDWEHPVLTGIKAGGLFRRCPDVRISLIIPQLNELADDNISLYRLIDEIDFTSQAFVSVTISGLPYRLKANAHSFFEQVTGFVQFIEKYQPDIDATKMFDLRFAAMIVRVTERN